MTIEEFIRSAIQDVKNVDPAVLTPDLAIDSLNLDSLGYVELLMAIDAQYGINSDAALFLSGRVRTLGDLRDYVASSTALE